MDKHEQWTSKLGFILAAAGSAIGLGAIWKFPLCSSFKRKCRDEEKICLDRWDAGIAAGIPNALSFGVLSNVKFLGKTFFELADFITSNIALPLGAFFIAIFAGYKLPRKLVKQELETGAGKNLLLFNIWYIAIRYFVPVGIGIVFLQSIGIL